MEYIYGKEECEKIYATVIRDKRRYGDTCLISKELLNELLNDKNFKVRQNDVLNDVRVYDIVHINEDGIRSVIIISEEI